ncbi:hypothetical protein SUGI_0928750 [Cryptomeria japonica]|nr:hypothetical protein SUGI_0928750 [Cryptomeria japonica]
MNEGASNILQLRREKSVNVVASGNCFEETQDGVKSPCPEQEATKIVSREDVSKVVSFHQVEEKSSNVDLHAENSVDKNRNDYLKDGEVLVKSPNDVGSVKVIVSDIGSDLEGLVSSKGQLGCTFKDRQSSPVMSSSFGMFVTKGVIPKVSSTLNLNGILSVMDLSTIVLDTAQSPSVERSREDKENINLEDIKFDEEMSYTKVDRRKKKTQ